jgi:hypothetical protein
LDIFIAEPAPTNTPVAEISKKYGCTEDIPAAPSEAYALADIFSSPVYVNGAHGPNPIDTNIESNTTRVPPITIAIIVGIQSDLNTFQIEPEPISNTCFSFVGFLSLVIMFKLYSIQKRAIALLVVLT